MDAPMGIALLVVTSSPGGSYSNWWCSMFNADLALSVTMTAISTLLSVVMLPVNLIIYATASYSSKVASSLDWSALFISLAVVLGGISTGLLCSAKISSRRFNLLANKLGNIAGITLVTYSIIKSIGGSDDVDDNAKTIWDQDLKFFFGIASPCVAGLCIAVLLTSYFQLEKPERVAVAVESCYQNTGIATSVAIAMFKGDELSVAIGVPLFYGLCEAVVLAVFCLGAWKAGWTKAPADESICVVIAKTYELEEAYQEDQEAVEVMGSLSNEGGLPSDLIFASTEEGDEIDETSLCAAEPSSDPPLKMVDAPESGSASNNSGELGELATLDDDDYVYDAVGVESPNSNRIGRVDSRNPELFVDLAEHSEPDDVGLTMPGKLDVRPLD